MARGDIPGPPPNILTPNKKVKLSGKKAHYQNTRAEKVIMQLSDGTEAHLYPYDIVEDDDGWLQGFSDHLKPQTRNKTAPSP